MTDNDKLIEEAAKAILDAAGVIPSERYEEMWSLARRDAEAALAVFEKAHAPTDDERLHVEWALSYAQRYWRHGGEPESRRALSVLASVVRRTEVPEPSAEEEIDPEICKGCDEYDPQALCMVSSDTQGEPSDAHLSNVSINGVRQTWQQMYEQEHEAHLALQGYRTMLSDMDRNASGRHEGDYDSHAGGNGGISAGNPHLTTGQVIGYDIGGHEYVVPEPRDRGSLSAWMRAAGGVR